jgi:8-hydroxy-5-deazaflavin:NADPH oxidoreductase
MEIGIIGAGMIGGTLARLLTARGHGVLVGTRTPDGPRVTGLPATVHRGTLADAALFGSATIVAVPFGQWPDLAEVLRPLTKERIILDTSNAIPRRDGSMADQALASDRGSASAVAALLPRARIVKAFNTVHFAALIERAGLEPRLGVPLAGDDSDALAVASSVVVSAGFSPVVAGPLRAAAKFDFGTPLFNVALSEADLRRELFPTS